MHESPVTYTTSPHIDITVSGYRGLHPISNRCLATRNTRFRQLVWTAGHPQPQGKSGRKREKVMRVPYSTWIKIIGQAQRIGTFDFCGEEVTKVAICLALEHVGLWRGEEVEWS